MRVKTSSNEHDGETFDPDAFRFVLVEPQSGGNVGAAARALKNLGYAGLHLVAPRCDPQGAEARRMAVEAADLLDRVAVHDDLDRALRGAGTVVGTSRRTGKHRRPHYGLEQLSPELVRLADGGNVALVFGREAHGLSDAELDRCTHLVRFAASAAYPSFNLAQSVLLVGYELRRASSDRAVNGPAVPTAGHVEREAMYRHLQRALLAIGHLKPDTITSTMRRFRRLLGRTAMAPDEVALLRGVAHQVLWCARQAGLEVPEEREDVAETAADEPGPHRP